MDISSDTLCLSALEILLLKLDPDFIRIRYNEKIQAQREAAKAAMQEKKAKKSKKDKDAE